MHSRFIDYKNEILTVVISGAGFSVTLTDLNEMIQTGVLIVAFVGGLIGVYKSIRNFNKK